MQLYTYATHLAKNKKYQINFIVADYRQPSSEKIKNVHLITSVKIGQKLNLLETILWPFKLFKSLINAHSDVYIQRSAGIETVITAVYCRLFRKKFIYMTASTVDVNLVYQKLHPIIGSLYHLAIQSAHNIIVQTTEQQILLTQNYRLNSSIIRNSLKPPKSSPPKHRKFILWVGSSQSLKRPECLLKIAQILTTEKFVMIMPQNNLSIWKNITLQAKKIPNLTIIKHVPYHQINYFYRHAKLFVNTSSIEGFPNTFVQSLANSTPIASLSVDPDHFIAKYHCGIIGHDNLTLFIKEITNLLGHHQKYLRTQTNSLRYFNQHHLVNKNITLLEKIINPNFSYTL